MEYLSQLVKCSIVGRHAETTLSLHTQLMCLLDPDSDTGEQPAKYSGKEGSKSSTLKYQKPQRQPSRGFHCTPGADLCHFPSPLERLKWKILDSNVLKHSSCYQAAVLARAREGRWRDYTQCLLSAPRQGSLRHQYGRCPKDNRGSFVNPLRLRLQFLLWRICRAAKEPAKPGRQQAETSQGRSLEGFINK